MKYTFVLRLCPYGHSRDVRDDPMRIRVQLRQIYNIIGNEVECRRVSQKKERKKKFEIDTKTSSKESGTKKHAKPIQHKYCYKTRL